MVKLVSGIFIVGGIYGCDRDEKRRLEAASVAGDVAGNMPHNRTEPHGSISSGVSSAHCGWVLA